MRRLCSRYRRQVLGCDIVIRWVCGYLAVVGDKDCAWFRGQEAISMRKCCGCALWRHLGVVRKKYRGCDEGYCLREVTIRSAKFDVAD
jgi:hypothetical protein